MTLDAGYDGRRLSVWTAAWRDRVAGNPARANARMGYLRAPQGDGKVLWIKAGGSRDSVRLGAELLGAIRRKRLDVRIALTFERDYADILEPRVRGLRKIGLGYGPSDLPSVARRTLRRLAPLGLVLADTRPSPNLQAAATEAGVHVVAFNTDPASTPIEAAYPCDARQVEQWRTSGLATHLAQAADPLSLFVEAQADTTLRTLVTGGRELELWWFLGAGDELAGFIDAWRRSPLAGSGILFVSDLESQAAGTDLSSAGVRISAWAREGLAPGTVVWVDDQRWCPAVGTSVLAAHCAVLDRPHLWSVLAGGPALTASQSVRDEYRNLDPCIIATGGTEQTLAGWAQLRDEPIRARQSGDRCRRLVWEERRRVEAVLQEFLQRVFDW